jgi:hypothetical protein
VSVAAAAALMAMLGPGEWTVRLRRAALAASPSVAFLLAWHLVGASDEAPLRDARLYGGWESLGHWLRPVGGVLEGWLVPLTPGAMASVLGVVLGIVLCLALPRAAVWAVPAARRFATIATAVALFHVGVVGASWLFVDSEIPLSDRMLSPLFVLAAIAISAGVVGSWNRSVRPRLRDSPAVIAIAAWCVLGVVQIQAGLTAVRERGQFYTAVVWDQSVVLRWVENLGRTGGPVPYSNEPELLYLRTGRPAYRLPRQGESLDAFKQAFERRPGPIVLVNPLRRTDLRPKHVTSKLDLRHVLSAADGVVYIPKP